MPIQQWGIVAKRVALVSLTALAIFFMGMNLLNSWNRPQIQSRLELYQTNLLLHLTEFRGDDDKLALTIKGLVGADPLQAAQEQYEKVRQINQANLERTQALLQKPSLELEQADALQASVKTQQKQLAELDLNLGILQAKQAPETARKTWAELIQRTASLPELDSLSKTAAVLTGLWSDPPQLLPNAEPQINKNLDGWFRYTALAQLYRSQQRQAPLQEIEATEQQAAERAFNGLAVISGVPILGSLIGTILLLVLVGQWLVNRKHALLSVENLQGWEVPWNGETVWQVLIFGFFLGQLLLPPVFDKLWNLSGLGTDLSSDRTFGFTSLGNYLLIALWTIGILYLSIKSHLPLPADWFRLSFQGNWFWWGLGGYFVAQPLVILVSLLNDKIWQGRGGSNPILPIALRGDTVTLAVICITAAIAAPLFEELLFRGFLLSSLTRSFPVWGAIALSSLIFALAHLSLSEVLPLTTLGMVLGFVYTRSRNLLASMLMHALWNSGTLLSLIILGSGHR